MKIITLHQFKQYLTEGYDNLPPGDYHNYIDNIQQYTDTLLQIEPIPTDIYLVELNTEYVYLKSKGYNYSETITLLSQKFKIDSTEIESLLSQKYYNNMKDNI